MDAAIKDKALDQEAAREIINEAGFDVSPRQVKRMFDRREFEVFLERGKLYVAESVLVAHINGILESGKKKWDA